MQRRPSPDPIARHIGIRLYGSAASIPLFRVHFLRHELAMLHFDGPLRRHPLYARSAAVPLLCPTKNASRVDISVTSQQYRFIAPLGRPMYRRPIKDGLSRRHQAVAAALLRARSRLPDAPPSYQYHLLNRHSPCALAIAELPPRV
jgi:hypothetical protein